MQGYSMIKINFWLRKRLSDACSYVPLRLLDWITRKNVIQTSIWHSPAMLVTGQVARSHVALNCHPMLVESWFRKAGKFILVGSGILGFEIQNKTLGIGNPTSLRNAETKIWYPVPEIRTPWLGIQNPILSWIPLHGAKIGSLCMASKPGAVNILVNT